MIYERLFAEFVRKTMAEFVKCGDTMVNMEMIMAKV